MSSKSINGFGGAVIEKDDVKGFAEKLIHQADLIHKSAVKNQKKREIMMHTEPSMFDSHPNIETDERERNNSANMPNANNANAANNKDNAAASATTRTYRRSLSNGADSSTRRKSKFQTVTELKQQLQDCRQALVDMQENASVKYRKLELEFVDLKAQLSHSKSDLDSAKVEIQKLTQTNISLERSLYKSLGAEKMTWFQEMEDKMNNLEKQCSLLRIERDEVMRDSEVMATAMSNCSRCKKLVPTYDEDASCKHDQSVGTVSTATTSVNSIWESVNSYFNLGAEAQASKVEAANVIAVRQEQLVLKEQSKRIKDDLEVDIEAMEKQMKDDIESLKAEWTKPSTKSKHRKKHRKKDRRGSGSSVISFGGKSLEAFLSDATAGLETEELDEEMSIFSKSRSVASAPATSNKHRKKKKRHTSSHHHHKRRTSKHHEKEQEEEQEEESKDKHRRHKHRTSGKTHRTTELDGTAYSIDETEEEEEEEGVIQDWGNEIRHPVTVL